MDRQPKHPADNDRTAGVDAKRPKHSHAGANPTEGREEQQSAAQAAAAPAAAASVAVSSLYLDTLGVVFQFLTFGELHRVLAVSREWPSVACRMPCAGFVQTMSPQSLVPVVSSRLARHITEVRTKLTSNEICILALSMTHLKELYCEVIPSDARLMMLPPKLQTLDLDLSKLNAAGINTAVQSIGRLTALVTLTLQFASWLADVSFAPLSRCAALKSLALAGPPTALPQQPPVPIPQQPTDAHIDQLRALHHLRIVSIAGLSSSSVAKLLRAPHSLEWTELKEVSDIDAVSAAALRNLPGLLMIDTWGCRNVSFLSALSQLHTLELQIGENPWAVSGDAVVEAISNCRHLTFLGLVAPVTFAHLSVLLPRLPLLHTLILYFCSELESLCFLNDVPTLRHTLRYLSLQHQPALRTSEIRHILALKNLDKLRLSFSFSEALDGFTRHVLTPPSTALPKLTSFVYESPAAAVA